MVKWPTEVGGDRVTIRLVRELKNDFGICGTVLINDFLSFTQPPVRAGVDRSGELHGKTCWGDTASSANHAKWPCVPNCVVSLLLWRFDSVRLRRTRGRVRKRHGFRVLIRVRAINIFEHWSAAWARSRFQRCLRPPCSFPDQRIRIGETAGKIIE